jgi:hypothetical protein
MAIRPYEYFSHHNLYLFHFSSLKTLPLLNQKPIYLFPNIFFLHRFQFRIFNVYTVFVRALIYMLFFSVSGSTGTYSLMLRKTLFYADKYEM